MPQLTCWAWANLGPRWVLLLQEAWATAGRCTEERGPWMPDRHTHARRWWEAVRLPMFLYFCTRWTTGDSRFEFWEIGLIRSEAGMTEGRLTRWQALVWWNWGKLWSTVAGVYRRRSSQSRPQKGPSKWHSGTQWLIGWPWLGEHRLRLRQNSIISSIRFGGQVPQQGTVFPSTANRSQLGQKGGIVAIHLYGLLLY